jgi:acyl-CoA thioesterase II
VGDLEKDTTVRPVGDGRYTARLSDDWEIWGPNGGYVASLALRAAGLASGRARPASLVGHMLSVARFDDVEIDTTVLRSSRVASSVRVSMRQGDRPILDALVWGVDDGGPELVHDITEMPEIPGPQEYLAWEEARVKIPEEERPPFFSFWNNIEARGDWWTELPDGPLEPVARWWMRFRPTVRFDDPWVDACRLLIPIDTMGWPAGHRPHAHRGPLGIIAPTIDLSVRFHRPAPTGAEWLLCESISPVADGGLMTATGRVWSPEGTLLASGGQSMLCRPG